MKTKLVRLAILVLLATAIYGCDPTKCAWHGDDHLVCRID